MLSLRVGLGHQPSAPRPTCMADARAIAANAREAQHRRYRPAVTPLGRTHLSPSSENEAADIPGVGLSEATNCFAPAVVKGYNVVSHGGGGGGGGGDESQVGRQSHVGHAARNTSSSVSAVAELQVSWLERFCLNAAGLLHINQISQEHVKSVESILKEGDKLKVMILSYDRDQGRVALSTKVLEPTPGDMLKDPQLVNDKAEETAEAFKLRAEAFRSRAATTQVGGKAKRVPAKWDGQVMPYKIGDVVEGVVKLIKPYGAFVNLGGFDGLLHISQITRGRIFSVTHILKEGDKLKVMILSYDRDRGRITLSTKKLEPSPGDMLTNPQLVFDKAEEMAEALKSRAAETQSRTDDSTGDQMASETYVY